MRLPLISKISTIADGSLISFGMTTDKLPSIIGFGNTCRGVWYSSNSRIRDGGLFIVSVNVSCLFPKALVAFTVNVNIPLVVGIPERMPVSENVKPGGNVPLSIVLTMGRVPAAVMSW